MTGLLLMYHPPKNSFCSLISVKIILLIIIIISPTFLSNQLKPDKVCNRLLELISQQDVLQK